MKTWRKLASILALHTLLGVSLLAPATAQQSLNVKFDFKETRLKNGLRVITAETHNAPIVSVVIAYDVGARDDPLGQTGMAHLFEHMMFEGSENVGRREHTVLIDQNGGIVGGVTNLDRTIYENTVPSNQLDLAIFLEADRMRSLAITQDNLNNQREVVKEEARLRYNRPYGKNQEVWRDLLFEDHPYGHSTLGSAQDIDALKVEDLKRFFNAYYAPNQAVLTLVGDFDTDQALARIKKYFEPIPRQPSPPTVKLDESEQKTERRVIVEDEFARLPVAFIGYKLSPGNSSAFYVAQILSALLQNGQSSRLFQSLVVEKDLAPGVSGGLMEHRGPSVFYFAVAAKPGKKIAEIEAAIYDEIERLKREPLTDRELQKAKNSAALDFINSIQTTRQRAIAIGEYAVLYDDPSLINERLGKIAAVTKSDAQRVAREYLKPSNRTVLIAMPREKTSGGAAIKKDEE